MKNNLKILESWLGTCRKYYCKLSGAIGGNDRLDLSFNIVSKDYVPINKYGTYNEPYDSFTITVSHLEKYTQSQMEDLINNINEEFKSRIWSRVNRNRSGSREGGECHARISNW